MNLWLRLLWLWVAGRSRPPISVLGPCCTPFRVSLFDLDLFRHMNNGRYFTIMDLARVDLMRRSGFLATLNRAGFYPVVTVASMFFRRSLNWRERFEIVTEVVAWDENSLLLSQRFMRADEEVATAVVRARFRRRSGGSVPTAELLLLVNEEVAYPSSPEWVAAWVDVFDAGIPGALRG